jgi:exodeoxyribonuclease VII large subunit
VLSADVLIVGRGGGSEEDLWAFNEEVVARAIFESQIPVVSAVGHETDVSIADFVADLRAPTPSAAAELVVPDRRALQNQVSRLAGRLTTSVKHATRLRKQRVLALVGSHAFNEPRTRIRFLNQRLDELTVRMDGAVRNRLARTRVSVEALKGRVESLDPRIPLARGFAIVETAEGPVTRAAQLEPGDQVDLRFNDGRRQARVTE